MNNTTISGIICSVPRLKVMPLGEKNVTVCTFTVAVTDDIFEVTEKDISYSESNVDFFECILFEEVANLVNANFMKGSKIICTGKMKNHCFEDCNRTKHFTQVLVVNQAEFGDTEAIYNKYISRNKKVDLSIVADLKEIYGLFQKACENGFLCLDEDEYYKIAMAKF